MKSPDQFKFFNQAKIISGNKGLNHIPVELDDYNAAKPLVITDKKTIAQKFDKIFLKSLSDSNVILGALYGSVGTEATISEVRELADLYVARGCDSIIAIGSESAMNTAKAVNLMISEKMDYLEISEANNHLKPLIAILTIDSKDTFTTDIVTVDSHTLQTNYLFPDVVIVDPRMIKGGDDASIIERSLLALTQSVEAAIYGVNNPMNDSYIYASSQYIAENIKVLLKKKNNIDAATAIGNAVYMAGVAFSNSTVGLAYTIADELHKLTGESKARIAAIVLPHTMKWADSKKDINIPDNLLQALVGIDKYVEIPREERSSRLIDVVENLTQSFKNNIPLSLKELKLQRYIVENIANTIPDLVDFKITTKETLAILDSAWDNSSTKENA